MYRFLTLALIAFAPLAQAYCDVQGRCVNWIFSPRIGIDWAQIGQSQHVQLLTTDEYPDYFETSQETSSQMLFGAFLGAEMTREDTAFRLVSGLAFYQPHIFTTEGIDYFLSDPDFGDKSYDYSVKNQRLLFENKVLYGIGNRFFLYLLAGIGANFNKAYGFHMTSLDMQTPPPTDKFESKSTTSFCYSGGAGFEVALNDQIRAGLGYQYTDLGTMSFGDFNNGNTDETISVTNVPDQEVVLFLTLFLK